MKRERWVLKLGRTGQSNHANRPGLSTVIAGDRGRGKLAFAATVGALVLLGCSNDDFDLASVDHAAAQRDGN